MNQNYKNLEPSKAVRLSYCVGISVVVILLMLRGEGLTGFQLSPVIVSFPVVIIFLAMMVAIIKAMSTDKSITKQ